MANWPSSTDVGTYLVIVRNRDGMTEQQMTVSLVKGAFGDVLRKVTESTYMSGRADIYSLTPDVQASLGASETVAFWYREMVKMGGINLLHVAWTQSLGNFHQLLVDWQKAMLTLPKAQQVAEAERISEAMLTHAKAVRDNFKEEVKDASQAEDR